MSDDVAQFICKAEALALMAGESVNQPRQQQFSTQTERTDQF
jgi:hypothetical protein